MSGNCEILEFETASEFLLALRPSNPKWIGDGWGSNWIFRGQRNGTWGLTPSAWRESVPQSLEPERFDEHAIRRARAGETMLQDVEESKVKLLLDQRAFEHFQIRTFVSLADQIGFDIPGGHLPNRNPWEIEPSDSLDPVPHPAIALAQHHGMATRLLDWTRNPLVAAFFAAEGAVQQDMPIAVWALHSGHLLFDRTWVPYEVPRSQIGFLHAQSGLFTYHRSADVYFVQHGTWPRLEDRCSETFLTKMLLPSHEADELIRLLFAENVSRVHLMPTLDNIRKTLDTIWSKPTDSEISR